MLSFITSTLEYRDWGLNALTISFLVSVSLTLIAAWGLLQQNKTIWSERTAEAVSVVWLSYYGVLQLAVLTYGFSLGSGALMINGLLAVIYVPILLGLQKFKGFTMIDTLAVLFFLAALVAMILTPYKPWFFLGFAIGGLFSAITQPIEMWRKKSAKGFEAKLVYTIMIGNVVWFTYGVAVTDWILISINAIAFGIFGTTLVLGRVYHQLRQDLSTA